VRNAVDDCRLHGAVLRGLSGRGQRPCKPAAAYRVFGRGPVQKSCSHVASQTQVHLSKRSAVYLVLAGIIPELKDRFSDQAGILLWFTDSCS